MNENLIKIIPEMETKTFVSYHLAYHCMPTLLKLKPANTFRLDKQYLHSRSDFLDALEHEIKQFGSNLNILFEDERSLFLMIYNRELLEELLQYKNNRALLRVYGYTFCGDSIADSVMMQIKRRFLGYQDKTIGFPHELGIILGYPIEDVMDFIRYQGSHYILCGFWKVYHKPDQALEIFEKYRKVRRDAVGLLLSGRDLTEIKKTDRNTFDSF